MTIDDLRASVAARRAELDRLRPLKAPAIEGLRSFFDIELTYTSNAIEGNTLSFSETAELIEHGITVGGKPLSHHLEAEDHYAAVQWMREIAAASVPLDELTVLQLHRRIVARSRPDIAGRYSDQMRRIRGSSVVFPPPHKVPALMEAFSARLFTLEGQPADAFWAHRELVTIHPFTDGNGRTARLLMNLLLIRGGWPPISVRPEDRRAYLDALQEAQLSGDRQSYDMLMLSRLDDTLADYVGLLNDSLDRESQ